jgi:hypothetical protein
MKGRQGEGEQEQAEEPESGFRPSDGGFETARRIGLGRVQ